LRMSGTGDVCRRSDAVLVVTLAAFSSGGAPGVRTRGDTGMRTALGDGTVVCAEAAAGAAAEEGDALPWISSVTGGRDCPFDDGMSDDADLVRVGDEFDIIRFPWLP